MHVHGHPSKNSNVLQEWNAGWMGESHVRKHVFRVSNANYIIMPKKENVESISWCGNLLGHSHVPATPECIMPWYHCPATNSLVQSPAAGHCYRLHSISFSFSTFSIASTVCFGACPVSCRTSFNLEIHSALSFYELYFP